LVNSHVVKSIKPQKMKRRELLGKAAVIASGSVFAGTLTSNANDKPTKNTNSENIEAENIQF